MLSQEIPANKEISKLKDSIKEIIGHASMYIYAQCTITHCFLILLNGNKNIKNPHPFSTMTWSKILPNKHMEMNRERKA